MLLAQHISTDFGKLSKRKDSSMEIVFRDCTSEDYDIVNQFMLELHEFHQAKRPDFFAECSAFPREVFDENSSSDSNKMFFAIIDNEVAGFCDVTFKKPNPFPIIKPRKVLYIEDIIVHKDFRRHGVGSAIYEECLRLAKEYSACSVELMVWPFNENALQFYENKGMTERAKIMEIKV